MLQSDSEGTVLRIYIGESDRRHGAPLYDWIVREARRQGLAGATVFRGIEGYGGHSHIHSARILRLSEDLPIVIEIVDTKERIAGFLPTVDEAVGEGLATLQPVEILLYRSGHSA